MNALTLKNYESVEIAVSADAVTMKESALDGASIIRFVTDATSEGLCVSARRELKRVIKLVEESRKIAKVPVLEMSKRIDAIAAEFVSALEAQEARLAKVHNAYATEQARLAAEVERKRQEEIRRIENERIAKENEARRQAEAEMRNARNERERQAAAERAQIESERIARETAAKAATVEVVKAPVKIEGKINLDVWKFEVLNIHTLYNSRPSYVRVEVNASAINEAIRAGLRECPGLRIYNEISAGVRV